jgi:hypothetical protein
MNPLNGAYERVNRASEHLVELKQRVSSIRDVYKRNITSEYYPVLRQLPFQGRYQNIHTWDVGAKPIEPLISILVGEIIYNLRAALDYLIYELGCFDSKCIVEKTQFVIVDAPNDFLRESNRRLKGLDAKHIASIERLQPYHGMQWLATLRDISNPDKHAHLAIANAPSKIVKKSKADSPAILLEMPMNVNYEVSIQIVFADGTPVIETLEKLVIKVRELLELFDSEFE